MVRVVKNTLRFFPTTRFGRRLAVVFSLAAVLPVAAMSVYLYKRTADHLLVEAYRRLELESLVIAHSAGDRIGLMDSALRLLKAELSSDLNSAAEGVGIVDGSEEHQWFSAVSVSRPDGSIQPVLGGPMRIPALEESGRVRLGDGHTLVRSVPGRERESSVVLGRAGATTESPGAVLWAELKREALLGSEPLIDGLAGIEVAILDRHGRVLASTGGLPRDFSSRLQSVQRQGQSRFEWAGADGPYLGAVASIRIEERYGGGAWTVVASEPKSLVLAPVAQFRKSFPIVVGLSLLVVVLASVFQLRRSLAPLAALRAGAQKMAERDFDVAVTVSSGDEFEDVADGFNLMAVRLGRQFHELTMIAAVSRATLEGCSVREIARPVLEGLPGALACDGVLLHLDDPRLAEEESTVRAIRADSNGCDGPLVLSGCDGETDDGEQRTRLSCELKADDRVLGRLEIVPPRNLVYGSVERERLGNLVSHLALALHQRLLSDEVTREREKLAATIEHLPSGVVLVDGEGSIVLRNPIADSFLPALTPEEEHGLSRLSELGGRPLEELALECDRSGFIQIETGGAERRFFLAGVARLRRSASGRGMVIVIRDVTQERKVESRLRQHDRLAAVGRLAAGISHDFNNILQGIMMSAELMYVDGNLEGEMGEAALGIFRQGERGARLIRQILDFSRTSEGAMREVDLVEVCQEGIRFLARSMPKRVTVETVWPDVAYIGVADPDRLQQLLANLVLNARDALAGPGSVRLTLDCVNDEGRKMEGVPSGVAWARLAVEDSGPGVDDSVSGQVFEPFFSTKGPGEGTGLGLAQVYGIVSQHGGRIDLEDSDLGGAKFVVYLPLREGQRRAGTSEDSESAPQGSGELVLVAQDDPTLLELTCTSLERLGYLHISSQSAAAALDAIEREGSDIDLVLADLALPDMTGIELARRAASMREGLPVVLMSGYAHQEDKRLEGVEDVAGWLAKPFTLGELGEALSVALGEDLE